MAVNTTYTSSIFRPVEPSIFRPVEPANECLPSFDSVQSLEDRLEGVLSTARTAHQRLDALEGVAINEVAQLPPGPRRGVLQLAADVSELVGSLNLRVHKLSAQIGAL